MLLSNYENCTNIKLSQTSFCNSNSSASVQFSGTKIVLQIMIVQTWPRSSWFGSQNQNHFKLNCKFLFDAYFLTNSTVDPTIYRSRMMVHIRVKCINKCLYTRISRAELLCLCPDKSVSFFVPWVLGQLCASEMLSVYVKIFTNKIISLCQVFPHVLQQKQNPLSKKYNTRFVMLEGWIRKQKSK